jgi:hypothetical protein
LCYRHYYLVAFGIGTAPPRHWHCSLSALALLSLGIGIALSRHWHCSLSALALLSLGIGIALSRHWHCSLSALALLSLDILIPGHSVSHLSASASLLSSYRHHLSLGIGILPSLHHLPRYRYPSHFSIIGIRRRYPSLALGLLLPTAPQSPHPPALSHCSLPTTQYHRYSYTPTNLLIETHKHSLQNRALYSYTMGCLVSCPRAWRCEGAGPVSQYWCIYAVTRPLVLILMSLA